MMMRIGFLMTTLSTVVAVAVSGQALAQVAGSTTLGVTTAEMKDVALGWSAKKQILGKVVRNDKNERVGTIDDVIISPGKTVSYAIVGAGGFAGIGKHDVAIPIDQFHTEGGTFVLAGATKDAIKAMPEFVYAAKPR